jgi:FkbM family methyltransferase
MKSKLMRLIKKLIRIYTFYTPIKRGKYILSEFVLKIGGLEQKEVPIKTKDGRRLVFPVGNISYRFVYFIGDYEPTISEIFRKIIRRGNVCLDVGANVGWYSTLFQRLVGETGEVHAFEPVPRTFEFLKRNVNLNKTSDNIVLNNVALGDAEKQVDIHLFPDLPDGHASISTFGRQRFETFPCRMITLDSYLDERNISNVNLVKIDIEGAELMMLKGASKLFMQKILPILEIEMALATSKSFGYTPNDLIEFLRSKADYDFYAIDEAKNKLFRIEGFRPEDIGANVLCVPRNYDLEINRLLS